MWYEILLENLSDNRGPFFGLATGIEYLTGVQGLGYVLSIMFQWLLIAYVAIKILNWLFLDRELR